MIHQAGLRLHLRTRWKQRYLIPGLSPGAVKTTGCFIPE